MTSTLLQVSVVHTFILCVVMRILMGFCVGWVFRADVSKRQLLTLAVSFGLLYLLVRWCRSQMEHND